MKFTSSGRYLTQWGSYGSGNSQFNSPSGVAVDASGNVYVTDRNTNRVEKFTTNGTYISQWGSKGSGAGQFNAPYGVAVDSTSNVYVIDEVHVEKFTSSGTFITQWGSIGSGPGQYNGPGWVAVDSSGNVYVTDTWNNRVVKFGSITTISVGQAVLIITTAAIVGSVGAYLTIRKRPKNRR
jgi:DNA-binding beta-propeller fold protein YncE